MAGLLAAVARGPDTPLLVALSGGLDSTVLLHALAADATVRARGLRALHVRHDLHPAAEQWAEHCRHLCREWQIPITVAPVQVPRDSGLGLEGAAREARHAAFAAELAPGETLVLAHHRGDQAETVLLRLLRASASEGLGAMRAERSLGHGRLWRPLLGFPRAELQQYAQAQALRWLEDPSNADLRHDRNFLRHRVLPLLQERWPESEAALARSAQLLREDAGLLEEEVERRLFSVGTDNPWMLSAAGLKALSPAWRTRVLRHWLATLGVPLPPGRAFARIDAELLDSRHDAQPELRWAGLRLERWRGLLHLERQQPVLERAFECAWDGSAPLELPGGDGLELSSIDGPGRLPEGLAPLRVAARQGGERIHLSGRAHTHALKDCLQRAAVPPWLRRRLPLLHAPDAELLAAGDVVLSARWQREVAAHGLRLRWRAAGRD